MAQQRTRSPRTRVTDRSQTNTSPLSTDMESHDDSLVSRPARQAGQQRRAAQVPAQQPQSPANELLASVTPAFQEARRYIEGSPLRAAAVGAIAGGLLMTLFSTEKGRSFVKMAYDYANPMVAKYAREYISQAAGDMTEQALSQH